MALFDFAVNAFTHARDLVAVISSTKLKAVSPEAQAFNFAIATVQGAVEAVHEMRLELIVHPLQAEDVVSDWKNVEDLERAEMGAAFVSADARLVQALLDNAGQDLRGRLQVQPSVVSRLVAQAQLMEQARAEALAAARANVRRSSKHALKELTAALQTIHPTDKKRRGMWYRAFNGDVVRKLNQMDDGYAVNLRRTSTVNFRNALHETYAKELNAFEERFEEEKGSRIRGSIWRRKNEPGRVMRILRDGERVPRQEIAPEFLNSNTFRVDQTINGISTVVDPDGSIWLQSRSFKDGGAFDFEKKWTDASPELEKQARAARSLDPYTEELTAPVKHMYFADRIPLTHSAKARLSPNEQIDMPAKKKSIREVVTKFAADMRGQSMDSETLSLTALEGLEQHAGLRNITYWLEQVSGRRISASIKADGLVYIAITLRKSTTGVPDVPQSEINTARLMALFVVAILDHAINGLGNAREYPEALPSDETRLEIPGNCVWPLQVKPRGRAATSRISTGAGLAKAMSGTTWDCAKPENWMLGWEQTPPKDATLYQTLENRFHNLTQLKLETMYGLGETLSEDRKGLNAADALGRLVSYFMVSSLVLSLIWLFGAIGTLYAAPYLSRADLWLFSLVFFLIAFWRFLLIGMTIGMTRDQNLSDSDLRPWKRFRLWLLNVSFGHRTAFCIGPTILFLVAVVAIVPRPDMVWVEALTAWIESWAPDKTLKPGAASFRSAMVNAVWTLPVVAAGLLRQAYVMLSQLLVDRGLVQDRLDWVNAIEDNWKAGTHFGAVPNSPSAHRITDQIETLRARLQNQRARADRQFGEKSATNATLVALVSMLSPLNGMQPDVGIDDTAVTGMLAQIGNRRTDRGFEPPIYAEANHVATHRVDASSPSSLPMLLPAREGCMTMPKKVAEESRKGEFQLLYQVAFTASLIDCLEVTSTKNARSLGHIQRQIAQQYASVAERLQRIEDGLPQGGGPKGGTTYVCMFPFLRHCAQGAQINITSDGFGNLREDLSDFTTEIYSTIAALEDLKAHSNIAVGLNADSFFEGMRDVNEVMSISAKPRQVPLTVDINQMLEDIGFAETRLGALGHADPVVVRANAEQFFHEMALARRLLETFPEQRQTWLGGRMSRPLVDIDLSMTAGGLVGALGQCDHLATRFFEVNEPARDQTPLVWAGNWTVQGKPINQPDGVRAALLLEANEQKPLYVLGLADGQGDPLHNLALSQARASLVAAGLKQLNSNLDPIALNLGEAGWLTERGLSDAEDDPSHRAALVYVCE
ncbi:MAG: hypothetical protein AAGF27_01255 [Pseudomonadota bacterium]